MVVGKGWWGQGGRSGSIGGGVNRIRVVGCMGSRNGVVGVKGVGGGRVKGVGGW